MLFRSRNLEPPALLDELPVQVPGRPRQYCTTQAFLRSFHLRTLEELPPLPGVEESGQLRLEENNPETGQEAERQQ